MTDIPKYKTKEYYKQKMRESRLRGKGKNPKTLYHIQINGETFVFDKSVLNKIKSHKLHTLNNPRVLIS